MKRFILSPVLVVFVTLTMLSSCDIVEGPKVKDDAFTGATKKALIEDFTGFRCTACPDAHNKLKELQDFYGDNVIGIAIHATQFAEPLPFDGYYEELRTPMGDVLAEDYKVVDRGIMPIGMVDRREWNTEVLCEYTTWSTYLGTVFAEEAQLGIELLTVYDDATRELTVEADLQYYVDGGETHRVVAVVTEDSIITKQKYYAAPNQYVADYPQNHVLRASITPGTYGIEVKNGNKVFAGETVSHTFTYAVPQDFKAEHCHVVVYVLEDVQGAILQAEEAHF